MDTVIQSLSNTLIGGIVNAVGLPRSTVAQQTFGLLFRKAAVRLAGIVVTFDRPIASGGFPFACAWVLTHWCCDITSRGSSNIPQSGPLPVISNHA